MHPETADKNMLLLSTKLGFLQDLSFYLAGGTGLALQIGHRKSFDLDFFTNREFSPENLSSLIKNHHIYSEGEMRRHGTLYCILERVKSSFIFYDGLIIFPFIELNTLNIADWRDITAEKLRTVSERGQKKDFYDLYCGVQKLGIKNVVELAGKKFGKRLNYFHLLKGITYFEDAERSPEPMMLDKNITWQDVKNFFVSHIQDFENAFRSLIK